jgi:hypothetical protein
MTATAIRHNDCCCCCSYLQRLLKRNVDSLSYFPFHDPSNESSQKKVHQYRTEEETVVMAEVSEEEAVPSPFHYFYFHLHFYYLNTLVVVV